MEIIPREKSNFYRLSRLLLLGGAPILREVFENLCPSDTAVHAILGKLQDNVLSTEELTRAQNDQLLQQYTEGFDIHDLDITLLCFLFRTTYQLLAPSNGWEEMPSENDYSLEADFVRIEWYEKRMRYYIYKDMAVPYSEFDNLWKVISEALVRLAGRLKLKDATSYFADWRLSELTSADVKTVNQWTQQYSKDTQRGACVNNRGSYGFTAVHSAPLTINTEAANRLSKINESQEYIRYTSSKQTRDSPLSDKSSPSPSSLRSGHTYSGTVMNYPVFNFYASPGASPGNGKCPMKSFTNQLSLQSGFPDTDSPNPLSPGCATELSVTPGTTPQQSLQDTNISTVSRQHCQLSANGFFDQLPRTWNTDDVSGLDHQHTEKAVEDGPNDFTPSAPPLSICSSWEGIDDLHDLGASSVPRASEGYQNRDVGVVGSIRQDHAEEEEREIDNQEAHQNNSFAYSFKTANDNRMSYPLSDRQSSETSITFPSSAPPGLSRGGDAASFGMRLYNEQEDTTLDEVSRDTQGAQCGITFRNSAPPGLSLEQDGTTFDDVSKIDDHDSHSEPALLSGNSSPFQTQPRNQQQDEDVQTNDGRCLHLHLKSKNDQMGSPASLSLRKAIDRCLNKEGHIADSVSDESMQFRSYLVESKRFTIGNLEYNGNECTIEIFPKSQRSLEDLWHDFITGDLNMIAQETLCCNERREELAVDIDAIEYKACCLQLAPVDIHQSAGPVHDLSSSMCSTRSHPQLTNMLPRSKSLGEVGHELAVKEVYEVLCKNGGSMNKQEAISCLSERSQLEVGKAGFLKKCEEGLYLRSEENRFIAVLCVRVCQTENCENQSCRDLHLCPYFLLGKCTYMKGCRKSHNVNDTHTNRILENLNLSRLDTRERIQLFQNLAHTLPGVCHHYNRNDKCTKSCSCAYLHVCKNWVMNRCIFMGKCRYTHHFKDKHEREILRRHHLVNLSDEEVLERLGCGKKDLNIDGNN